ncbi:hypothetical protein [Xanthomonas hydrangeae]|uniref:hypothetical protein n=1 Tax=Xanthomonas hydrangeae TaxID=2775159 RepID=UPI001962CEFB
MASLALTGVAVRTAVVFFIYLQVLLARALLGRLIVLTVLLAFGSAMLILCDVVGLFLLIAHGVRVQGE